MTFAGLVETTPPLFSSGLVVMSVVGGVKAPPADGAEVEEESGFYKDTGNSIMDPLLSGL